MPQTFTGWILFAAVALSGMTASSAGAAMLDDALSDGAIARRNVVTLLQVVGLMAVAGMMLVWVEGR